MKIYNTIILSAAILLVAADITLAQTYSIIPDDTINRVGIMEDVETLSIEQPNTTSDTIQLAWMKVSESVPAVWEAGACDNAICYTTLVDSGIMNPILPGEYGLLLMKITPHVNYGTATIRYAVWDIDYPALKDTLTYILTVNNITGISETENSKRLTIFPNPAKENITILSNQSAGFKFIITTVSGKEVQKGFSKTNILSLSLSELEDGVYTISIFADDKLINTKQFLVQH